MNKSISVVDSIELIPLDYTDVSSLITKVKIKVFHLGENRNRSYIDKDTALKMARGLRGNPIVAYYKEEKEDFSDHEKHIEITEKGVEFKTKTVPYGFVDLNADVWFEDYLDTDKQGNQALHTYVVTEGVVWTEQFQELQDTLVKDGERPHSMEIGKTKGFWADNINPNCDIFIINDAVITKLCMMGEDVEPCFVGSSISTQFSKENYPDGSFVRELLDLKEKIHYALNSNEGGSSMKKNGVGTEEGLDPTLNGQQPEDFKNDDKKDEEGKGGEGCENPEEKGQEDKKDDEEDKKGKGKDFVKDKEEEDEKKPEEKEDPKKDKEDDEEKKKAEKQFQDLSARFEELTNQFSALKQENEQLLAFKKEVEDKQKDELIESFNMLSEEDKKEVIDHKADFSLEEIKSKLSVIGFEKGVDFSLGKNQKDKNNGAQSDPMIFEMGGEGNTNLPSWLRAVEQVRNNRH